MPGTVPTLQQLYTPLTREDVLAVQLQVAAAVGLPIAAWESGSVGREFLEINAQSVANFSVTSMAAASGGLLAYAEGDWLTLLAFQLYQVTRVSATFGTTTVTLTNTSALSYTFAPGDIRLYDVDTGKTYTSTTGGTLAPGNITPTTLAVDIIADEAGTDSNAAAGGITGFVTPFLGVTSTNAEPLIATDEETDPALRTRCTESLAKASPNGPQDAYNYFAKTATRSDDSDIGVTRTNLVQGDGTITVYIADASGPIAAADVDAVDENIQLNCVPTGFTAETLNATGVTVDIEATVFLARTSTLTVAELTTLVEDRLEDYFAGSPIGGYQAGGGFIFTSAIIGEIFQAAVGQIIRVDLTNPLANVGLDANEVAVLGEITLTLGAP